MKVDGLTNDEVKSHLQVDFGFNFDCFFTSCFLNFNQVVTCWMALIKCSLLLFQKYRLHTRRAPNSSAATNGPVVMMGSLWVSQEHYSTSKQSASQSGSPQSPLQLAGAAITAGDSCEEEDGKSESYSWK